MIYFAGEETEDKGNLALERQNLDLNPPHCLLDRASINPVLGFIPYEDIEAQRSGLLQDPTARTSLAVGLQTCIQSLHFCDILAVQPWATHLTALGLGFCSYKVGMLIAPTF